MLALKCSALAVVGAASSDCLADASTEQVALVQRQASRMQAEPRATLNLTTPVPVANSCSGWSCSLEGQFCPPSVTGGGGADGYCCYSGTWSSGNACAVESGMVKVKYASSCRGWDCDTDGQFCPPTASGSGGVGYCCASGQWTAGNSCKPAKKNNQYVYAHRINDPVLIETILDQGGNIEVDIGFGAGEWRVTHFTDDANFNLKYRPLFKTWIEQLGSLLTGRSSDGRYLNAPHSKAGLFASLWIDVKNPNGEDPVNKPFAGNVKDVVDMVRANVPKNVAVIYDLGFKDHFLDGSGLTKGYQQIKDSKLLANEGIGAWMDSTSLISDGNGYPDVKEIYNQFKKDKITNTVVHHGHAFDIDESVLTAINMCEFHDPTDQYRFKKVFTWTNEVSSTMAQYIDPSTTYHTDGQIVGSGIREWVVSDGEITDFANALNHYADSQQKGAQDASAFWASSGSDCW